MRIPEVREQLKDIADQIRRLGLHPEAEHIEFLVTQLWRRRPIRKAKPNKSNIKRESILAFARQNPDMDYMDMAGALGVNTGRVSEALAGYRE